jgi:hypothetical protein
VGGVKLGRRSGVESHVDSHSIKLRAGEAGKAAIKMRSKGPSVALPSTPMQQDPHVIVQVHNVGTGRCWEAAYSTNKRNDSKQFKAKSD